MVILWALYGITPMAGKMVSCCLPWELPPRSESPATVHCFGASWQPVTKQMSSASSCYHTYALITPARVALRRHIEGGVGWSPCISPV
jgi:hypothetical protein